MLARLAQVRLLALDVDGTLTDGALYASSDGESLRFFVPDGLGLKLLLAEGLAVAWISGRNSPAAAARARSLGIEHVLLGVAHKSRELERLQAELGIDVQHTLAIGDDLPDLSLAARAGLFIAPANACAEVKARADWTLTRRGGEGAVRELADLLLASRGRWSSLVDDLAR